MKPIFEPFEARGVRLRPLATGDLPLTLAWRNREGVRQQFIFSDLLTLESHQGWFRKYSEKPDDFVFVVQDPETSVLVGQVAIYDVNVAAGRAEIGRFVVAPEAAGQGKMRRAIEALLVFARDMLGLSTAYLEVLESNLHAARIYEKLGFVETGRHDGRVAMERILDDSL